MLASVSNVEEAMIALEAEVDIVDLKNPAQGALGALPLKVIREIVLAIDGRKAISATIGDLAMEPELLVSAVERLQVLGVDIIKLGFFGTANHRQCIAALQPLIADGTRLVAVLFADKKPNFGLLPELGKAGFFAAMLDTANKNEGSLLDYMTNDDLMVFVELTDSCGLNSGLAGCLRLEHVAALTAIGPSYLGFRGAICANLQRKSAISKLKVIEIKELLHKSNKMLCRALSTLN